MQLLKFSNTFEKGSYSLPMKKGPSSSIVSSSCTTLLRRQELENKKYNSIQ